MDALPDPNQLGGALVAAAGAAVLNVCRAPQAWAVLFGVGLADLFIAAARKLKKASEGESSSDLRDAVWLAVWPACCLLQASSPNAGAGWRVFVLYAGGGVAFRLLAPPIARILGIERFLAWVATPLVWVTRTVAKGIMFLLRPVLSLLGRLPRPSAFQFAMGAVLCGCAVLTGLLVKTLVRF